jgi:hypothetical protein
MRKSTAFLLAAVSLIATAGIAAEHAQEEELAPPTVTFAAHQHSIPFELFRGNRIVVPAKLNGHSTELILDTGASATTVDKAYARSIGLPAGQKMEATGAGGVVEAEIVPNVTLEVGGMRFEKMTVAVMDLQPIARGVGRPVDVVLGREFFNSAVVSIDWAGKRLRVSSHDAFKPAAGTSEVALAKKGPFNTIPVSIAGGEPIQALLDLGNGGALSLPRTYWGARPNLAGLRYAESRRGGVGGLSPARAAMIPTVTLANRTFSSVPATLSEGGNDHDAE